MYPARQTQSTPASCKPIDHRLVVGFAVGEILVGQYRRFQTVLGRPLDARRVGAIGDHDCDFGRNLT